MLMVKRGLSRMPTTSMPASVKGLMPSRYSRHFGLERGFLVGQGRNREDGVGPVVQDVLRAGPVEGVAVRVPLRGLPAEAAVALQERDHFPAVALGDGAERGHVLLGVGVAEHHDPLGDLVRLVVLQAALQQRVAGDVLVRAQPVDVRPLVLHRRRRGDDLRFRRGLAGVFRRQGGRAGGQFPGLGRGRRLVGHELALPHGDRTRQQGTAGGNHDGGAPGAALAASAIRAAASPRSGWSARPGRRTRQRCTGPGPGSAP